MTEDGNSLPPLKDFDTRLHQAQEWAKKRKEIEGTEDVPAQGIMQGLGVAMRMATELVAALAIGVGLGYFVDIWLESRPFGLIVGFFLGVMAGAMNVYRTAMRMGLVWGYNRQDSMSENYQEKNSNKKEKYRG